MLSKKITLIALTLVIITSTVALSSCAENSSTSLPIGKYRPPDETIPLELTIIDSNTYMLTVRIWSVMAPTGKYKIKDNQLILDKGKYVFDINNDGSLAYAKSLSTITEKSLYAITFIEDGEVFVLSEE